MQSRLSLVLLLAFIATVLSAGAASKSSPIQELRASVCSANSNVDACLARNDFAHPQRGSKHVSCMWCHNHHDESDVACVSLTDVKRDNKYKTGWVCDYHTPVMDHTTRKHHHGLNVDASPLDLEDPYGSGGSGKMGGSMMPKGGKSGGSGGMMGGSMMPKGGMMTNPKGGMTNPKGGSMSGGKSATGMAMGKGKEGMMEEPIDASISGTVKQFLAKAPKPVQFLGGLAMGVMGTIPFQPTKVIAGVDAVQNDIQNLFSKFSLASGSKLANDVVLLANTVKDFAKLLKDAGAVEVAEKAAKVAAKADNPIGWIIGAGELALNGVNIYQDFSGAIDAYKSGNNFELGKKIGDIISILAE